jgi:hypothetical protein
VEPAHTASTPACLLSSPAAGLEQQQGNNPPGFQPQPLLCPPPLFAKQPQFDYAFK